MEYTTTFSALTAENGTGNEPYRWQMRLLGRFLAGDLPAAVDVPTGLGKTTVMALWLMALAAGAALPRRLVYVVDRRAVVDQATRFAERLRRNLPSTLAGDLGLGDRPLPISTLRGGFADNRDWLEDPSRPAIVVGTVDMVGSRLLFAGYGVSRRMRPYHAGFLGTDTLVVLDEAHLCPPFETLLRDVAERRDGVFGATECASSAPDTPPPPFRLMSLSATGRTSPAPNATSSVDSTFRLQKGDHDEAQVRERLTARKRLALVPIGDPKGLADELAHHAASLGDDPPARVLVYCDSRRVALEVRKRIEQTILHKAKTRPDRAHGACELLVGERRAYERGALEQWLEHRGFLSGAPSSPLAPTFLVATSAGEVGVDLDADHLVCDLVAYERMVQRLGRVNRRGGATRKAHVDVLIPRAGEEDEAAELELDARMAPLKQLPQGADGRHDASPQATVKLRSDPTSAALIERATTPAPLYPELTRPLVEAWAMTSLKEHAGRPEVEPWLRGWEEQEEPHTTVVWRRYLPRVRVGNVSTAPERLVPSFFDTAPTHATERLEAVTSHVTSWMLARAQQVRMRPADHDQAVPIDDIIALVLDRAGDLRTTASLYELLSAARNRGRRLRSWERSLAGATLIVDSAICGLAGGMLDEGSDEPVATADADQHWQELPEAPHSERPMVRFRVHPLATSPDGDGLQPAELNGWQHARTFETELDGEGAPCGGLAVFTWPDDAADEHARSFKANPQTLRDHTDQVAARVREIAARLGLPAAETDALLMAAELHDEGKAARRWQDAMNAPEDGRPYAKTRGGHWRLLEGYRHEFGSLLKAEQASLPADTRDLILHLVAAHHGHGRPLIESAGCQEAPPSVLEATARDAALRYARLQRRYGLWGLAWREAILRAADRSASREGAGRWLSPPYQSIC